MIKTVALIFLLTINGVCLKAQNGMPSYPDVIKKFASRYKSSEDFNDYTSFAKKKDGWYVQQVNKEAGDKVLNEHLFYSQQKHKYLSLKKDYDTTYLDNPNIVVARFLSAGDWYNYERLRYFGYDQWVDDMIRDFGNRQDLSDTMLDGLGRAYSARASNYLWHQAGHFYHGNDSLQIMLMPLQFPSPERMDSVEAMLVKLIEVFQRLEKINPHYKTIIGDSKLKVFNEYMYAYNLLLVCGNMDAAKAFAAKASLQQQHIDQAKNHLNSCAANAILFTYGDNDTYQLWYVQEVLGYRKDVLVINTSMLGLPVYTEVLKKFYGLKTSVPAKFLSNEGASLAYYEEGKGAVSSGRHVSSFLQDIYLKKDSLPSRTTEGKVISYPKYSDTAAYFTMQDGSHKPVKIKFTLKKILYLNDVQMLDIINSNINTRPICFTSPETMFENHLQHSGIEYRLVAEDISSEGERRKEEAGIEKFIAGTYLPVLSDSSINTFDGDASFINLYGTALGFYTDKGDTANMRKWADKFYKAWRAEKRPAYISLMSFGFYFIEADYKSKGKEIMEESADVMYKMHADPDATAQYISFEYCKSKIEGMRNYLSSKGMSSKKLDDIAVKLEEEEFMYENMD